MVIKVVRYCVIEEEERKRNLNKDPVKKNNSNKDMESALLQVALDFYNSTYNSLFVFNEKIFSDAIKKKYSRYVSGDYVKRACDTLQFNKRSMYVGPRGHFKSLRFYSKIGWIIWRNKKEKRSIRIDYLSYNDNLAGKHVSLIKDLINKSLLPQEGLVDMSSTATSKAKYVWDDGSPIEQQPSIEIDSYGIMGGLRGGHPNYLFLDDPYQDESNDKKRRLSLEPVVIKKINDVFETKVLPMPVGNADNELHVIGTAQSNSDLWFQDKFQRKNPKDELKFTVSIEPAYVRKVDGTEALWPELYPLDFLKQQEEMMGPVKFGQEYLCVPIASTSALLDPARIEQSVLLGKDIGLVNYDFADPNAPKFNEFQFGSFIYAAYDPGKMQHPGHLAVFSLEGGELHQLLSKWFDGWDYAYTSPNKPSQIKYVKDAVEYFGILKVYADNTNGVLTQSMEMNEIPQMVEMKISSRLKGTMATEIERVMGKPMLRLVDDERQSRAFLALQGDFRILEDRDHHGEPITTVGFVIIHTIASAKIGYKRVAKLVMNNVDLMRKPLYRGYF